MGYYSSAMFFRPGPPPRVTSRDLAAFLERLRGLPICAESETISLELNWGDPAKEKIRPFYIERAVDYRPRWQRWFGKRQLTTMSVIKGVEADLEMADALWSDAIDQLNTQNELIGRLHITGGLPEKLITMLTAAHRSGEKINFWPHSWAFSLDETELTMLSWCDITSVQIGWMHFSIHGDGHFFPWTFNEWVDQFAGDPRLVEVSDLCRSTWPVNPIRPPKKLIKLRHQFSDGWPYKDPTAAVDWAWGPEEG